MDFSVSETINAPRAAVMAALRDPQYFATLGEELTNLEAPELLHVDADGDIVTTSVRYAFAGEVSGAARMAVDADKLTWVITTKLHAEDCTGSFTVVPDHYDNMLSCSGTLRFDDHGDETLETVAGTLEVHIPLIGSTAEKAILGGFTRHLEGEAEALARFCARA